MKAIASQDEGARRYFARAFSPTDPDPVKAFYGRCFAEFFFDGAGQGWLWRNAK